MSVKKEKSGRRSIEVEVVVPGTPEEVWKAIATGPGISSWFCPVEVDERVGGTISVQMGPKMEAVGTVTKWEPPRRLLAEGKTWGPEGPTVATEWTVEARSGGTCVVRVVHSLFATSDDWDNELENTESGWPNFFGILQLYLAHFRGQPCAILRVMRPVPGTEAEAWTSLLEALGLSGANAGQRWETSQPGAPRLAGTVERIGAAEGHRAYLRLDEPTPGIASPSAFSMGGGQVHVMVSIYYYGKGAADAVARDEPVWNTWMAERFPAPAETPASR